jgi:hypothetical protein
MLYYTFVDNWIKMSFLERKKEINYNIESFKQRKHKVYIIYIYIQKQGK